MGRGPFYAQTHRKMPTLPKSIPAGGAKLTIPGLASSLTNVGAATVTLQTNSGNVYATLSQGQTHNFTTYQHSINIVTDSVATVSINYIADPVPSLPADIQVAADVRYLPFSAMLPVWVPCTNTTSFNDVASLSNGTTLGSLTNWRILPEVSGFGLQIQYGNVGQNPNNTPAAGWSEFVNPDDIVVEWGVYIGATFVQGTFQGQKAFTMQGGTPVIHTSDMLNIPVVAGTPIVGQLRVTVASSKKFHPANNRLVSIFTLGQAVSNGASSDGDPIPAIGTAISGVTPSGGVNLAVLPFNYLTRSSSPKKSVVLDGDSNIVGFGDAGSADSTAGLQYPGHVRRGLHALGIASVCLGMVGDFSRYRQPGARTAKGQLYGGATHAIVEGGINDLADGRTAAQIYADNLAIATELASVGLIVGAQQLLLRTSDSTTLFATAAGQTPHATVPAINQYNALISSLPTPFTFVVTQNQVLFDGNGKWLNGGSTPVIFTGGSTTTATFASASFNTGRYTQYVLRFDTGARAGTYAQVTNSAYAGGTGTLTIASGSAIANGDTGALIQVYTNDGLHPNRWGCEVAAQCITPATLP